MILKVEISRILYCATQTLIQKVEMVTILEIYNISFINQQFINRVTLKVSWTTVALDKCLEERYSLDSIHNYSTHYQVHLSELDNLCRIW